MTVTADFAFLHAYVCWVQNRAFCYAAPADKERFHLESKRALRILARELKLSPGNFDIRSSKGGVATSGEILLHSSTLYVQIHATWPYSGVHLLYRRCTGRFDMTGKANHFAPIHALLDLKTLVRRLTTVASL